MRRRDPVNDQVEQHPAVVRAAAELEVARARAAHALASRTGNLTTEQHNERTAAANLERIRATVRNAIVSTHAAPVRGGAAAILEQFRADTYTTDEREALIRELRQGVGAGTIDLPATPAMRARLNPAQVSRRQVPDTQRPVFPWDNHDAMRERRVRVYQFLPKRSWPAGPWIREPDKILWLEPNGIIGMLARDPESGAWGGFAGVGPTYPSFGQDVADVFPDGHPLRAQREMYGLESDTHPQGFSHCPEPGDPEVVWWFGRLWDQTALGDLRPRERGADSLKYRGMKEVHADVLEIAAELHALYEAIQLRRRLAASIPQRGPRELGEGTLNRGVLPDKKRRRL